MRFIVGTIEQARSKAKFMQKCLDRFEVRRSLTQCQAYLATSFGFGSWAEMKTSCQKAQSDGGREVDIHQFRKMVLNDFQTGSIGNLHAYAVFARMGYCQSVHHFDFKFGGFHREFIDPAEAATALEMIFERYLEIEPRCAEVNGLIAMADAIIAPYADVHPGSFERNSLIFIDQMKSLRIPGMTFPGPTFSEDRVGETIRQLPDHGTFTLVGENRDESQASAIAFLKLARRHVKTALPLRWLVEQKARPVEGTVYYLPSLSDGSRRFVEEFGKTNRILVVDNAPSDAGLVSVSDVAAREALQIAPISSASTGPSMANPIYAVTLREGRRTLIELYDHRDVGSDMKVVDGATASEWIMKSLPHRTGLWVDGRDGEPRVRRLCDPSKARQYDI